MRIIVALLFLGFLTISCNQKNEVLVDSTYVDSLLDHFYSPRLEESKNNLEFWDKRMDSLPDNFVNGPKYAAALSAWFHISGSIHSLKKADSLVRASSLAHNSKDPDILRGIASMALLQHRFKEADSLHKLLVVLEGNTIANSFLDFDIVFERGDYAKAKNLLTVLNKDESYGYFFRRAKFEHYDGELDSSIHYMLAAAEKAGNNKNLRQTALSNAADLSLHKGDPEAAVDLYRKSILIDPSDLHSITGLGWIALVHDKNDSLAEKIFRFVKNKTESPDILLKLMQLAEARGDISHQKKYAVEFEQIASRAEYGAMYTKYLIDLYTGLLHEPAKALPLAEAETFNRPTPQAYAWYAWSWFKAKQADKANEIYKGFVSQKPLEAMELYYMGMMMKEMGKGYNAKQFFKAAWKNKYDLSPAKQNIVKENLD